MTSQDRFPRCGDRLWGYDTAQVDDLLDRLEALRATTTPPAASEPVPTSARVDSAARTPSGEGTDPATGSHAVGDRRMGSRQLRERVFDRARGGYDPAAVDAHLDVLEDELFERERTAFVAEHGEQRWNEHVEWLGGLLLGRLNRPHSERFRRPRKHRTQGYSAAEVDVLCDRLVAELRSGEDVSPELLRHAVFRPAQGQRCYEEQQVDAFLDRAVEFVLAVRGRGA